MNATAPSVRGIDTIRRAGALAQHGDMRGAIATIETALADGVDVGVLSGLAGILACHSGDLPRGIAHLHRALAAAPDDVTTRANLAQALTEAERADEAWPLVDADRAGCDPTGRIWRLRGQLQQVRGEMSGAERSYTRAVAARPDDFESWNNLGNLRAELGDGAGALDALDRAVSLRPDLIEIRLNQAAVAAESLGEADAAALFGECMRDFPGDPRPIAELGILLARLHREADAVEILSRAIAMTPDDPNLAVRLGEVCVVIADLARAEAEFCRALALVPDHADAHLQLAIFYETGNRLADLKALVRSAEAISVERGVLDFMRALDLRRADDFAGALAAMQATPEDVEPGRRFQLIAQCLDRLGDTHAAFAAFAEMNRLNARDPTAPLERGAAYRDGIREAMRIVTPAWYRSWTAPFVTGAHPAPVFLVGFPRSGTTLLDTFLMGHPAVTVMEELPVLQSVQTAIGGLDALATMDEAAVEAARARYFEEAARQGGWRPGRTLVDKFPMSLLKMPLIHRLFPDATIILALRHPCDAVLSCFMASFKLNDAMTSFLDLGTAAETYDLAFDYWTRCRDVLALRVREIRYEDVVADPAGALRPLVEAIGLDWHDAILDNAATAKGRASIRTASYAQVVEPVYARAVGRWRRYRSELAPVLPIIEPWIARLGYAL